MYELDHPEWYVLTKLVPPTVRGHTVHRPHLEERLCYSVSTNGLTLLSAPAGYGKTTLLALLPVLVPDYPLAWISIDEEENDPVRFIGLLVAALGKLHPQCGQSALSRIAGGVNNDSDLRKVVTALINDIVSYISEPFILVLDDLHFVTEFMVYQVLDNLLEQRPPNLHLAIGTRTDPALRLSRLAARGQLGEFRRGDLSLNLDQTLQLLNDTLNLNLSSFEASILYERTEGWPGVLCLLAGPLARMESPEQRLQFLESLSHSEGRIYDFLMEEILFDIPEYERLFLLQTSILSEITPNICRAVTGREDSDVVLSNLYRRNLAIAAISLNPDGEPVYRYHALLARMLRERLNWEYSSEVIDLHRRAAEIQKTPGRAIAHYLQAGLWEQAVQLIISYGMQMLYQGMAETIQQWYNKLPSEVKGSYPKLTVLLARSEIHRGDYEAAGRLLEKASFDVECAADEVDVLTSQITLAYDAGDRKKVERYVRRGSELPLNPVGKVAVGIASAWLHLSNSSWDAVCAHVCEALKVPATTNDRRADLIGVTYTTAFMAALPGCMQAIDAYCAEVTATAASDSAWYLGAQELASWILLWRGQIDESRARLACAEALRQKLSGYPFVGNDLPVLRSILSLASGDFEAAESSLELLQQRIERPGRNKVMLHFHAAGRMMALLGRREEALTMLRKLESLDMDCKLTCYLVWHLRGLVATLNDEQGEAKNALKKAIELEDELPMAHVSGSARLIGASLLLEQRKPKDALDLAKPVLNKWHQASLPGFALADGPIILPVLRLARDSDLPGAVWMLNLFSKNIVLPKQQSSKGSKTKVHSSETLSPREQDVLRLLMEGCTNLQISAELHISPETVKTHISKIFRKLNVSSRTQAAIRARELGL